MPAGRHGNGDLANYALFPNAEGVERKKDECSTLSELGNHQILYDLCISYGAIHVKSFQDFYTSN